MSQGIRGRTAVVTGAARGLGQAFAVRLAQEGARVAVVDRLPADETLRLIEDAGANAFAIAVDLANPGEVTRAAEEAEALLGGGVDILVNNAGIFPFKPFAEMTYGDWRSVMSVNLDALFLLTHPLVAGMRRRHWGRVVNITSNTCWAVAPNLAHYVTSKMAVIGFTRALASEVGNDGITVNAIAPSLTITPGTQASVRAEDYSHWATGQSITRPALPTDLTGALVFLCSDEAAFMTAQTLVVDGGQFRI